MTTGIDLLNVLKTKANYLRYSKYINTKVLDEHVADIISSMDAFFTAHPDSESIDWSKFAPWYSLVHNSMASDAESEVYSLIFKQLADTADDEISVEVSTVVDHFIKLEAVAKAADILLKIADGDKNASVYEAKDILDAYLDDVSVEQDTAEYGEHGLTGLLEDVVRTGGFEWRLEDLNRSVGPLHRGDLAIIVARPETGKTSFICSELTYMIPQDASEGRDAIIFNNEEAESKIRLRLYNTALNKGVRELEEDEAGAQAEYESMMGSLDRVRIIGKGGLSIHDIEYYVKKYNPAIVAVNVMHKIKGFDRIKNEVERLGRLYSWAREVAKKSDCVFMLVAQADGTAEGQEWIKQNQIYGSKTEVQGEADVIVTIGKVHDGAKKDIRYIHVPKNKMPPGPRTDPVMKHGYHEVDFDGDTGVYKSKTYKVRTV